MQTPPFIITDLLYQPGRLNQGRKFPKMSPRHVGNDVKIAVERSHGITGIASSTRHLTLTYHFHQWLL